MKTSVHLIASLVLAAVFYPMFNWKVLFIIAGGVLIDVDHYFWYIKRFNSFNLIKCYVYFVNEISKTKWNDILGSILIFHTIEFLFAVAVLSLFSTYILLFAIGLLGHYVLDFIWHYYVPKRALINHSLISWYIKNKIQKV